MNETKDTETLEVINSDIVFQQDKAQIDIQISTAKAYPRNIKRSAENAIAIVTMDQETAKTCTYSLPRGGKAITGPSVHLAKILAQVWGNLRVEAKVVAIDAKHVTSEAVAWDLENNLAIKAQIKRIITGKAGRFNDDMITVTGNAANSIALRNAVLSVVPRNIVDRVYNAAKQTITGDLTDKQKLIAKRKQVMDGFMQTYEGLTEKEILNAIGKAAIDHITPDDLVVLIGIGQSIKDGDTTVEQAFRPRGAEAKQTLTADDKERKRIEDFISNETELTALEIYEALVDAHGLRQHLEEKKKSLSKNK